MIERGRGGSGLAVRLNHAILCLAAISEAEDDVNSIITPKSAAQAFRSDHAEQWTESMVRELTSLNKLETWTLVPKSEIKSDDVYAIGIWRYRVKTKNGNISSFKSRYCYNGRNVVDLPEDVYAPTARFTSVMIILFIASRTGAIIKSGDIPSAYVQALMPEGRRYFVAQPPGFINRDHPDWVLLLHKAIYGVPIAGHQ